MAVVSTHLELHQLGSHKHLRATTSYTAVVCLGDRLRVYSAMSCYYEELLCTLLLHAYNYVRT